MGHGLVISLGHDFAHSSEIQNVIKLSFISQVNLTRRVCLMFTGRALCLKERFPVSLSILCCDCPFSLASSYSKSK